MKSQAWDSSYGATSAALALGGREGPWSRPAGAREAAGRGWVRGLWGPGWGRNYSPGSPLGSGAMRK